MMQIWSTPKKLPIHIKYQHSDKSALIDQILNAVGSNITIEVASIDHDQKVEFTEYWKAIKDPDLGKDLIERLDSASVHLSAPEFLPKLFRLVQDENLISSRTIVVKKLLQSNMVWTWTDEKAIVDLFLSFKLDSQRLESDFREAVFNSLSDNFLNEYVKKILSENKKSPKFIQLYEIAAKENGEKCRAAIVHWIMSQDLISLSSEHLENVIVLLLCQRHSSGLVELFKFANQNNHRAEAVRKIIFSWLTRFLNEKEPQIIPDHYDFFVELTANLGSPINFRRLIDVHASNKVFAQKAAVNLIVCNPKILYSRVVNDTLLQLINLVDDSEDGAILKTKFIQGLKDDIACLILLIQHHKITLEDLCLHAPQSVVLLLKNKTSEDPILTSFLKTLFENTNSHLIEILLSKIRDIPHYIPELIRHHLISLDILVQKHADLIPELFKFIEGDESIKKYFLPLCLNQNHIDPWLYSEIIKDHPENIILLCKLAGPQAGKKFQEDLAQAIGYVSSNEDGLRNILRILAVPDKNGVTGWHLLTQHAGSYRDKILNAIIEKFPLFDLDQLNNLGNEIRRAGFKKSNSPFHGLFKEQGMHSFFGLSEYGRTGISQTLLHGIKKAIQHKQQDIETYKNTNPNKFKELQKLQSYTTGRYRSLF